MVSEIFSYFDGGADFRNWRKARLTHFLGLARIVLVHDSHLSTSSSTIWWLRGVAVVKLRSSAYALTKDLSSLTFSACSASRGERKSSKRLKTQSKRIVERTQP